MVSLSGWIKVDDYKNFCYYQRIKIISPRLVKVAFLRHIPKDQSDWPNGTPLSVKSSLDYILPRIKSSTAATTLSSSKESHITEPYEEWNNAICSDMGRPRVFHPEWKSERERHVSYNITHIRDIKIWHKYTYLKSRNRVTDVENKLFSILVMTYIGKESKNGWIYVNVPDSLCWTAESNTTL